MVHSFPVFPLAMLQVVLDGLVRGGADGAVEVTCRPESVTPKLRLDPVPAFLSDPS